jgi:hypothetical protein
LYELWDENVVGDKGI